MIIENQEKINLVLASDENYALWMGMVIFSCLDKTEAPENLDFYILDAGITSSTKSRLERLVVDYQATISWLKPDSEQFTGFTIKRYGVATYFRLAVASVLPKRINKIIYLDCDLLITDEIAKLWKIALDGKIIGAVENLGIAPNDINIDRKNYFNAGVLLIDLNMWRASNTEAELFKCLKGSHDKLQYLDQDALNIVLRGKWKRLPLRWNIQPSTWSKVEKRKTTQTGYSHEEFVHALQKPGLIHFLAKSKPWIFMTFHPYKKDYLKLVNQVFPGTAQPHATIYKKLVRLLQIEKQLKNHFRSQKSGSLSYSKERSKF